MGAGDVYDVDAEHFHSIRLPVPRPLQPSSPDGEEQELVAYVVAGATEPIVEEELRRHLESKLPRYMQPGLIAQLATMPRLATGKPDRRGLPEVERTRRRGSSRRSRRR